MASTTAGRRRSSIAGAGRPAEPSAPASPDADMKRAAASAEMMSLSDAFKKTGTPTASSPAAGRRRGSVTALSSTVTATKTPTTPRGPAVHERLYQGSSSRNPSRGASPLPQQQQSTTAQPAPKPSSRRPSLDASQLTAGRVGSRRGSLSAAEAEEFPITISGFGRPSVRHRSALADRPLTPTGGPVSRLGNATYIDLASPTTPTRPRSPGGRPMRSNPTSPNVEFRETGAFGASESADQVPTRSTDSGEDLTAESTGELRPTGSNSAEIPVPIVEPPTSGSAAPHLLGDGGGGGGGALKKGEGVSFRTAFTVTEPSGFFPAPDGGDGEGPLGSHEGNLDAFGATLPEGSDDGDDAELLGPKQNDSSTGQPPKQQEDTVTYDAVAAEDTTKRATPAAASLSAATEEDQPRAPSESQTALSGGGGDAAAPTTTHDSHRPTDDVVVNMTGDYSGREGALNEHVSTTGPTAGESTDEHPQQPEPKALQTEGPQTVEERQPRPAPATSLGSGPNTATTTPHATSGAAVAGHSTTAIEAPSVGPGVTKKRAVADGHPPTTPSSESHKPHLRQRRSPPQSGPTHAHEMVTITSHTTVVEVAPRHGGRVPLGGGVGHLPPSNRRRRPSQVGFGEKVLRFVRNALGGCCNVDECDRGERLLPRCDEEAAARLVYVDATLLQDLQEAASARTVA